MKIIDRKTFLALPGEVLFSKYEPCVFDDFAIKVGNCGPNDFCVDDLAGSIACHGSNEYVDLLNDAEKSGAPLSMDFHYTGRDGLYDADQLYAVYERADIEALIARLQLVLERSA